MKNLKPMGVFTVNQGFYNDPPKLYQIGVSIDLERLASYMARAAIRNKSGRSHLAAGLIVAYNLTSKGVTTNEKPL